MMANFTTGPAANIGVFNQGIGYYIFAIVRIHAKGRCGIAPKRHDGNFKRSTYMHESGIITKQLHAFRHQKGRLIYI